MSNLNYLLEVTGLPESAVQKPRNQAMQDFLNEPGTNVILMPTNILTFFNPKELRFLMLATSDFTYPDKINCKTWDEKYRVVFEIMMGEKEAEKAMKNLVKLGLIKKNQNFKNGRKCCFNVDYENLNVLSAAMDGMEGKHKRGFRKFIGTKDITYLSKEDVQNYINHIKKEA